MDDVKELADVDEPDPIAVVDDRLSSTADRAERRRGTTPTRHSWAAQRPFDLRTGTDLPEAQLFDPVARAHERRATWTRPLIAPRRRG